MTKSVPALMAFALVSLVAPSALGQSPIKAAPEPPQSLPDPLPSDQPAADEIDRSPGAETSQALGTAWVELGFHRGEDSWLKGGDTTAVATLVRGRFYGYGRYEFEVTIPTVFALAELDGQSGSTLRLGNPYFEGYAVNEFGPLITRLGGGMALPMAEIRTGSGGSESDLSDLTVDRAAYTRVRKMGGYYDMWLWVPDALTLTMAGDASYMAAPDLFVTAAAAGGILIPTGDQPGADSETVARVHADLLYASGIFAIGLRTLAVWFPHAASDAAITNAKLEVSDEFQASLEPHLQVGARSFYVVGRLTIPLNAPAGFAFTDEGVWGAWLGGGADF